MATRKLMRKKGANEHNISSETATLLRFLRSIIVLPFNTIMYISGKKRLRDLTEPLEIIRVFLTEARFTMLMFTLNVTIFFLSAFFPQELIYMLGVSPLNLIKGRFYTLITAGFLHADIFHLVGNMTFLLIFGRVVERKMGHGKTAVIYFGALALSSLISSIIYLVVGKNVLGIGASGALMGLVASAMLLDPLYLTYFFIIPMPIMFVGWMALYGDIIGILTPIETNIGHLAHLAGFFSVSMIIYFFKETDKNIMRRGLIINLISLAVATILFTVMR